MGAGALILNQPGVYLVDVDGNAITVTDGLAIGSAEALIVAGKDGANARFIRVAADGTVRIDPTGTTTQPISAVSLPLPAGAATAALQTQPGVDIGDVTINNAGGGAAVNIQDGGNSITVDGPLTDAQLRASAVPVSVASLPLPTGAATEVTLATRASESTLAVVKTNTDNLDVALSTRLAEATFTTRINTLGQKAMSVSTPVVLSSDQSDVGIKQATAANLNAQVQGVAADGAAASGNPVLIAGSDGTNAQTVKTDDQGRIVIAATAGALNGFSDGQIVLASTTVTAVRSTTYTEPSSNAQRSISSSSALDTAAGTGARTVEVTYYALAAGIITGPFTETIALNGVLPVNTVAADICFIEKLVVLTVGSGGVNAGVITLHAAAAGVGTVWTIAAGANKTFAAHHYVPDGSTCKITGLLVGIKGADTTSGFLRTKNPANANAAEVQITDNIRAPSSGQSFRAYGTPIEVVGPSRIIGYVAADSTSSRTYYMSFDFYEE